MGKLLARSSCKEHAFQNRIETLRNRNSSVSPDYFNSTIRERDFNFEPNEDKFC